MRRLLQLISAVLAFIALFAGIALVANGLANERPQPPADVQSAGTAYAELKSLRSGANVAMLDASRAAHPDRFVQSMSKTSINDGAYFRSTGSLAPDGNVDDRRAWSSRGEVPIPYPPIEAWCVRLDSGDAVVVALHRDLYHASWILHELNDATAVVEKLGCTTK